MLELRFVFKTFTREIVKRMRKTKKTLAPVVHTITIMMSGLLLICFGAGVVGSGGGLEARLLSPASRVAKEIPVTTAVATFLATTPATGPKGNGSTIPTAEKASTAIVKRAIIKK